MRIEYRTLSKLPVVTESGDRFGSVVDLELDADAHAVSAYLVRQGMFGVPLRVSPTQVVSITAERMTVKDTAVPVASRKKIATARTAATIEPIATRGRN
ncbi:hypothetical protein A3D72_02210 [Candidatus Uhrbacteria bacterium RIFCSPHIGHO2_02_FULL_57_19]|uniref:PRC-barrel domain-containing protein n=1 Tax=Candidatus Uhrbacteria bacterium RIFCSPHIGHO2_02_FULL_57_19 TaxID=1802391 RepID=A0A1F7U3N0_9BACT|nr:MAG: hypothetical protein A3D72_02210 [Candidatus Uhrbacteria bacterium RIFCSPHIGHO2_02_FULL_57_19]